MRATAPQSVSPKTDAISGSNDQVALLGFGHAARRFVAPFRDCFALTAPPVPLIDTDAAKLVVVGTAHHGIDEPLAAITATVPNSWAHDAQGIEINNTVLPVVPHVKSLGIVEGIVNKFTRKDVLDDLAKTMLASAADEVDQLGDLRISRTLYTQIKLWASRKFTETNKQRAFLLRCLYRFELTNDLVHTFKMLNPRPFGVTAEARICIQTEFGKMMKEINRLAREETTSSSIPDQIVTRYSRTMGHDRKFHTWCCTIGPSLVIARSKTQDLADRIWEFAVEQAKEVGAAW